MEKNQKTYFFQHSSGHMFPLSPITDAEAKNYVKNKRKTDPGAKLIEKTEETGAREVNLY